MCSRTTWARWSGVIASSSSAVITFGASATSPAYRRRNGGCRNHLDGAPGLCEGIDGARLWEVFDAGESIDEIAGGYDMPAEQIAAAIAYEEQLRSLAA